MEIFRLCVRQGWLDPAHPNAKPARPHKRPGGRTGQEVMRRLRRLAGLLLPQGPAARKLEYAWDGVLPTGWIPIKERRKQQRARGNGRAKPAEEAVPF